MMNLGNIAEELFAKIRGRFPNVTIGNKEGNVTTEPSEARFFEFSYKTEGRDLGNISISLDEENGIVIMHNNAVAEDQLVKQEWFDFLKEMRRFAKKRLLNFNTRDIKKSNLEKRDYKYLANRSKDETMTESKLYGTGRVSYQNVDNARMVIKHTENIDQTIPSARTRKIGSIYIESSEGERFKYPYRHLSGARAMARHVAEGGNPYDDFGSHILGLSEEMSKLRKFKTYMGRSAVMAESLAEYMDIVKERISTVKKTIENLQKPGYYKEAIDGFEKPMFEDVPEDVAENWVDELTIRQFNEELKDVFPYIYNLVKEGTRAKALGPADLLGEAKDDCDETCPKSCPDCGGTGDPKKYKEQQNEDKDPCWKNYKMVGTKKKGGKTVPNCVPKEEIELEQGFEEMMGQFREAEVGTVYMRFRERKTPQDETYLIAFAGFANSPEELQMDTASRKYMKLTDKADIVKAVKDVKNDKVFVGAKDMVVFVDNPAMAKKYKHLGEALTMLEQFGKKQGIEVQYKAKDPDKQGEKGSGKKRLPKGHAASAMKNYKDAESERTTYFTIDNDRLMKFLKTKAPQIMNAFRPNLGMFVMDQKQYRSFRNWLRSDAVVTRFGETGVRVDKERSFSQDKGREFEGNAYANAVRQAKMNGKKKGDKIDHPNGKEQITLEKKTPLPEFILSYFDYTTGQFPKGETAILTMVEKDYGEEFIEPAKAFIERVNERVAEVMGFRQEPEIQELDDISRLAGL